MCHIGFIQTGRYTSCDFRSIVRQSVWRPYKKAYRALWRQWGGRDDGKRVEYTRRGI